MFTYLQSTLTTIFHFLTGHQFLPPPPPPPSSTMSPSPPSSPPKNILILGASFAGISLSHRLLKPTLKPSPNTPSNFKITLISPNTDLYWSLASPLAILPSKIPENKLFTPIEAGFEKYGKGKFEFINGAATSVDFEGKKVVVSLPSSEGKDGDKVERMVEYDFLVLATGSRTIGPNGEGLPFKGLGSTEETKKSLREWQGKVKDAKKIVVAGAGITGVEVAGELGFEYGSSKEIILISNTPTILASSLIIPSMSRDATTTLQNLHVTIKASTKVISSTALPSGQTELTLSSGDKLLADLYIPTFGVTPNSEFIEKRYLNEDGFVEVDEYLRVKGTKDVYAIGDISAIESPQAIVTDKHSAHVAKTLLLVLSGKNPLPYKKSNSPGIGLSVGRKSAVGHFGGWRVPGFLIVWIRRNMFTERLEGAVEGKYV